MSGDSALVTPLNPIRYRSSALSNSNNNIITATQFRLVLLQYPAGATPHHS